MEVDNLFETLTVKEIKQQNIKTRTEIERKKEELRFLVSERYRDVIDAADTIFEMKTCASEINDSLKRINTIYKDWNSMITHKSMLNKIVTDIEDVKRANKLSAAAQIKLILSMSELIWHALETKQFSKATMLFNICRNMSIHSKLVGEKYKDDKLDLVQIFDRHWSSLSNLEKTIGLVCRNFLKSTKAHHTTDVVLDSLLAILLLEDQNMDLVLVEYLESIDNLIYDLFSPKNSCVPINQQLKFVATIITTTIGNVYHMFIQNQIITRLEHLAKIQVKDMDCTKQGRIYRHLPDGISLFKPAHKSFQQNKDCMNCENIIAFTNSWLQKCRNKYNNSFVSSFKFLSTVKSLGEVRSDLDGIFNKLTEDPSQSIEWRQLEEDNCKEWKIMIKNIYSVKLKEILEENITKLFLNWSHSIEKFLDVNTNLLNEDEFELDSFFNYFWTEFNNDVFFHPENALSASSVVENPSSISKTVFDSLYNHFVNFFDVGMSASNKSCSFDSLVVKFKVVRPEIHQITRIFNNELYQMICEFISTINDNEEFHWIILKECLSFIVNRCNNWAEKLALNESLEGSSLSEVWKQDKLLYEFKTEATSTVSNYQLKMIILSQSLRTIYELLPAFQAGFMTSVFNSEHSKSSSPEMKTIARRKSKNSRLPFLPGKRINHQQDLEHVMWTNWNEVVDPLKAIVDKFVVSGARPSVSSLICGYFLTMKHGFSSIEACDEICTKWMPINSENNELNIAMTLPVEVPTQCSWPMHMLLFNISQLLSIFGAHSITRKTNDGIRSQVLNTVIDEFKIIQESEEFQENKSIQKQNVQLIFDLRFLLEIINAKAGIEKNIQDNLRLLLNEIEKKVDPFDYEMMSESLHQNLTLNVAKNSSMYWLLSSSQSKKYSSFGQKLDVGTSQHNLIDLVGSNTGKTVKSSLRFAMLPVSGYTLTDKNFASDSPSKPQPTEIKSKTETLTFNNHSKSEYRKSENLSANISSSNKSYFGRLGSNWF